VSDLRVIPSIEQLRQRPAIRALEAQYGPAAAVDALRAGTDAVRTAIAAAGQPVDAQAVTSRIEAAAADHLARAFRSSLRRVINATGVVLHTNLGRAPLPAVAIERIGEISTGYSTLEYDLAEGGRGRRPPGRIPAWNIPWRPRRSARSRRWEAVRVRGWCAAPRQWR